MSLPRSIKQRGAASLCAVLLLPWLLSACGSLPFPRSKSGESAPTSPTGSSGGTLSNSPSAAPSGGAAKSAEPPLQARADFDSAVNMMKAGNTVGAQDAFQRLAAAYPAYVSPQVNLGILYRKAGNLDKSEEALQDAVNRNRESAVAWSELGVTQRLRGEFKLAQDSYENALRAEPDYAPAYRNLGVLLDLYLGDPEGALDNFERYQALSHEDKPVSVWIAELRARTGKPPIRNKPVAPASESASGAAPGENAPAEEGASSAPSPDEDAAQPPSPPPAEPKRG